MKKKDTPRRSLPPTEYGMFVKREFKKLPMSTRKNAPKAMKVIAAQWRKMQAQKPKAEPPTKPALPKLTHPLTLNDLEPMVTAKQQVDPAAKAAGAGSEEEALAKLMSEYSADEVEGLVKMAEGLTKTPQGRAVLEGIEQGKGLQEALDQALASGAEQKESDIVGEQTAPKRGRKKNTANEQ